jgi:hypothetical protein
MLFGPFVELFVRQCLLQIVAVAAKIHQDNEDLRTSVCSPTASVSVVSIVSTTSTAATHANTAYRGSATEAPVQDSRMSDRK